MYPIPRRPLSGKVHERLQVAHDLILHRLLMTASAVPPVPSGSREDNCIKNHTALATAIICLSFPRIVPRDRVAV